MNISTLSVEQINPFPGLRPFQQGEEHLFFGREKQTDTLIDNLNRTRFLAVIGSSGSGKSSLVNCGLLNALRGGAMTGVGSAWRIAHCRPAGSPIRSLANALAADGVLFDNFDSGTMNLVDIVDSNLHMSQQGIGDVFEQSRQKPDVNLLVVVDQFEELFRYAPHDATGVEASDEEHGEAAKFIKLLLAAHEQSQHPIYIVLTMRVDFLGDCTRFDGLAEAINESQYLVPRMSRNERRLAISGPVGVGGGKIDPVLLTRLVNDLGDDPDQLSILQHALNRIWKRWIELGQPDEQLTLAHYSAIGSMKSALNIHAEKAFGELTSPREQLIAEKLFKALTNKATDPRGVRRPTSVATLCNLTGADIDELTAVIDRFRTPTRSFLMPPHTQALMPDSIIDISHESLMRMWKRLIIWASEEAESTHTFQRLTTTAVLHANSQAGLWRDPDLQLALEWRMHNDPSEQWASRIRPGYKQAMQFLDDSRAASDAEAAEAIHRADKDRELEQSRAIALEQRKTIQAQMQTARKQKQVSWLIAGGLIVTSVLSYLSVKENKQTQAQLQDTVLAALTVARERQTSNKLNDDKLTMNSESRTILNVTLDLLRDNQIIQSDQPTAGEFTNSTESRLLLFKVDSKGYETQPTVVLPGESRILEGYANQIWVTRLVPEATLHAVGTLQEDGSTVTL